MKPYIHLTIALSVLASARAEFGAYYTKIASGEAFEEFSRTGPEADIVVRDIGPDSEYPLVAADQTMTVAIAASRDQPLANVCFAVRNWGAGGKAGVLMNGKPPAEVRQGTFIDTDGTNTMVVWIEVEATERQCRDLCVRQACC